jgi:hypothetical protein
MSATRDAPRGIAGRAGGVLTGVGSAGGGLAIGPDTLAGKILILVSPLASVAVDYATVQARFSLQRWEAFRPLRQARRTLKKAIKDPDIPQKVKLAYQKQLTELHDAQIKSAVARAHEVLVPDAPSSSGN